MSGAATWEDHFNNIAKARKDGFEVVFGDDETLLLDIDTEAQMEHYKEMLPVFKKVFQVVQLDEWQSKSGNTHVALKISQPLSVEIRIALQAVLGSDPRRTLCEVQQLIKPANPIALFKPRKAKL